MALTDVIANIQDTLGVLTGIRGAPDAPPEQINVFPFIVVYPTGGEWIFGTAGEKKGLHDVVIELHVARKDLPRDVVTALGYAESIPNAIMKDPTFGGYASTFGSIDYDFGPLGWGGMETIGFKFTIRRLKMMSAIT